MRERLLLLRCLYFSLPDIHPSQGPRETFFSLSFQKVTMSNKQLIQQGSVSTYIYSCLLLSLNSTIELFLFIRISSSYVKPECSA
jgi:hypothetical protein